VFIPDLPLFGSGIAESELSEHRGVGKSARALLQHTSRRQQRAGARHERWNVTKH
jgi:hypothetical protein